MNNLAVEYLKSKGSTIEDYDGLCGELADDILHWLGEHRREELKKVDAKIMYIEPAHEDESLQLFHASPTFTEFNWSYHMVVVVDGIVHDAWAPHALFDPSEYMDTVFAGQEARFSFPEE